VFRCLVVAASLCFLLAAGEAAQGAGRLWETLPAELAADPEVARLQLRRNLVSTTKLSIAVLGTALLLWGVALRGAGRPQAHRRLRDALLLALAAASLFGWWNFLHFHYPGYVHANNVYVYYFGSKYFRELGYSRLYECTAVADVEAGLRRRVARRRITNLETYALESTAPILADPGRCTRHFSAGRWSLFKRDLAWFRSRLPTERWEALQRDHGYNPTPAWGILGTLLASSGILGTLLASSGPASTGQILALTLLDPALALLMWGCVWWAFGREATCVALLYWGTNYPAEFGWTGGSYLRDDWLAATVIGLCLLRRGRMLGAGFLLGHATLLRVFPVLALLAIGLKALLEMGRERRLQLAPEHRRLVLGGLLALATVLPVSALVAGGFRPWLDFVHNARLHMDTPGSNSMGLKTTLSYDSAARLEILQERDPDPGKAWKEARRRAFSKRRPAFFVLAVGFLALLVRALFRQEDWAAGVLGLGALPILLEPACYYTSVLLVFGLLSTRREIVGAGLCALSAVLWATAAAWYEWDDIFTWSSVAVVLFVTFATAMMRRR
jgi:hypothetical protein